MKVLIADDYALFRNGLSSLISNIDNSASVREVSKYIQLLRELDNEKNFELVIFDPDMKDANWKTSIDEIKKKTRGCKLVIVSASENTGNIKSCLAKGVSGYINKRSEISVLNNALRDIIGGKIYTPSPLLKDSTNFDIGSSILTNRQLQVLKLVAEGLSNKQIAYKIGVSEATIKLHMNALLKAVGANNRTQAVVVAQRLGMI